MTQTSTGAPEVKSAARTMELLEHLAAQVGQPVRLRDITEALGTPRSSTHALLRTLVSRGWVRTDRTGTCYALGIRALLVGTSFLDADPYVRAVRPVMVGLSELLNETVHLARLDGDDVVYLATQESHRYLRTVSRVGRRLPAHATGLGKAILAERPGDVPADLPGVTARTITERGALLADLAAVRERGYAVDDEENTPGLRCFGVALRYTTPVRDAFSCSVPLARLDAGREAEILAAMEDARRRAEQVAPPEAMF
ncbi:IclR family transcriptional regulator [Georgenia sp. SYP-B2076]|uniref:IclR family transcriptional regulator n=1 Tax=Georgenia sp. SYP-B2076 TaxID=2495881 RepID=UPI000F8E88BA|nr:IclR family transcriptional regulator [Georgenia sp. SYP-B2076]